jgi:hypothetical protein
VKKAGVSVGCMCQAILMIISWLLTMTLIMRRAISALRITWRILKLMKYSNDEEISLRYSYRNEDFVRWWRDYRNKTVLSHGKFEDDGFGEIARFIYCKGEKHTFYGKISNITNTERVIADAGGISVGEIVGVKYERK